MRLPNLASHPDAGLLVLRLGLAVILLFHGVYKLTHGVAGLGGPLSAVGLPRFLAYGTYVAEVVAPVLLIVGLWTRAAALVIAFDMVMALFLVKRGDIGKINPGGGDWAIQSEVIILANALAIALAGGGRYALGRGR
jgi:putative oxidoreductase